MPGRHRRRSPGRPRRSWPDKAVGTKYGAAYCDWVVTLRVVVIQLAPYGGMALVALASRWAIPHLGDILP